MNKNTCNTCAWFCHSDGRCYGATFEGSRMSLATRETGCGRWSFDGLKDEEREDADALVTMDEVTA